MTSEFRFYRANRRTDSVGYYLSLEDTYSINDVGYSLLKEGNTQQETLESDIIQLIGVVSFDAEKQFNSRIRIGGLPTKETKGKNSVNLMNILNYCLEHPNTSVSDKDVIIIRVDHYPKD